MDKKTEQELLELVKQNYEQIAPSFNETRKKALWPELVKLTSDVKDGESVLDVGCGNGRLIEAFGEKKINYVGIDQDEKLIELARSRFQASRPPRFARRCGRAGFRLQVGNILELDKAVTEKFDYIFCVAVLHHIPGRELRIEALGQLKNQLKPDGKIILTVWNLWSQWKYLRLAAYFSFLKLSGQSKMDFGDLVFKWGKAGSERYYHVFTGKELSGLFKAAGLKIGSFYKDHYNYYSVVRRP